jgi:hypothetical protein
MGIWQLARAIREGEKLRRNLKKEERDAAPTKVTSRVSISSADLPCSESLFAGSAQAYRNYILFKPVSEAFQSSVTTVSLRESVTVFAGSPPTAGHPHHRRHQQNHAGW